MDKIQDLEDRLGHRFKDRKELYRALTHPTFSKEEKEKKIGARDCPHQEIYATLGDAVLKTGFVWLLMENGLESKGDITIKKEDWEKNLKLAEVGKRLRLLEDNLIWHRMGKGGQLEKGKKTLCSGTVEALIGAIFIDTGYSLPETKICISKIFAPELQDLERNLYR
jgi:ribonuclease-3